MLLKRKKISTADVARATGYHRNHIARVRTGQTEPTRECMAAIFEYVHSRVDNLEIQDLFEFRARRKVS